MLPKHIVFYDSFLSEFGFVEISVKGSRTNLKKQIPDSTITKHILLKK